MKDCILHGNCIETLKTIPDASVDCCITSPPYYGLRDYGTGEWIGGDPNCPHRRMSKFSEKTTTGHKQEELIGNVGDAIYKTVCPLCGAIFGKSHTKHGQHATKLYRKWSSIKARCYCVSCKQYKRYGGRGITMCDEWHYSFEAFSKWAYANGYDPNKNGRNWSIDRIDNSKGYSPDNCRFATAKEQQINRDITTLYEYKGKQYTASEFADVFNVDKCMVYRRVKQGESLEQILEYWNKAHSVPDGFVDTLEYAKTKGVTRTTVCKWIKQGKLKAERYGRKWYIMPVC